MARRRAQAVRRGRPTAPRGPQGPSRGRSRRRAQAVKRPTAPRGPKGSQAASKSPRGRAMAKMSPSQVRSLRARSPRARGPKGPQSGATSRPTINLGQGLRKFMDTMPRAPRGPMSGIQLANQNAMQRQMDAALGSQAGKRGSLFGAMGNVPQRPIPNRDGRMAQMQADLARAARANMAAARQRPPGISMDPGRGTFGRGMRGPQGPRPMPPSNYMRQPMPAQQLQRGMGRGPMPRANIGQIQAPRPTFGQQMRPIAPGQRLSRRRVTPRRR